MRLVIKPQQRFNNRKSHKPEEINLIDDEENGMVRFYIVTLIFELNFIFLATLEFYYI